MQACGYRGRTWFNVTLGMVRRDNQLGWTPDLEHGPGYQRIHSSAGAPRTGWGCGIGQTFPESEAVGVLSWALATRERMQSQPHSSWSSWRQQSLPWGAWARAFHVSASLFDDMTATAQREAVIVAAVVKPRSIDEQRRT